MRINKVTCNKGFVNVDVLYVFQCYSVKVAWFIVEIPYLGRRGLLGLGHFLVLPDALEGVTHLLPRTPPAELTTQ